VLIALVWVGSLFCSVTRDYSAVTAFFGAGMLVAFIAVTASYDFAPELWVMLWASASDSRSPSSGS
jgi:hypothetical protein